MKELITSQEVKALLTDEEIKAIEALGITVDSQWNDAFLTGSRAFGTANEESDLDIAFEEHVLSHLIGIKKDPRKIPSGWELKDNLGSGDSDYEDTDINITYGRLNIFSLSRELGFYPMYQDATRICMDNGNKEIFKNFCKLATENDWYI